MALKIGFAEKYFTLWEIINEQKYTYDSNGNAHAIGKMWYYNFKQNLSIDESKAIYKAALMGCTDLEPDTNLHGARRSFKRFEKLEVTPENYEPYEFHFGKYHKNDIRECDSAGYLKWMYENNDFSSDEQKEIIMKRAVELRPDWLAIHKGELVPQYVVENYRQGKIYNKEASNFGYVDVEFKTQLKEGGVASFGDFTIQFPDYKEMWWEDFRYYVPVFDGKAKRIKNKKFRVFFSHRNQNGVWVVRGLKKI